MRYTARQRDNKYHCDEKWLGQLHSVKSLSPPWMPSDIRIYEENALVSVNYLAQLKR